jgi:hypothetical protein
MPFPPDQMTNSNVIEQCYMCTFYFYVKIIEIVNCD